jgi:L-rhamnonate dehydratase
MPEDLDGLQSLRTRLPGQTLAGGEHWYTLPPFAHAGRRRLLDILQPDIGWACGLTGCMKIAQLAQGFGQSVMLHAGVNTPYGQHFSLAVPNCPMGEYFVGSAPGIPFEEVRLTPGMQVPVSGRVHPGDEPGFGLGLTLESLETLKV